MIIHACNRVRGGWGWGCCDFYRALGAIWAFVARQKVYFRRIDRLRFACEPGLADGWHRPTTTVAGTYRHCSEDEMGGGGGGWSKSLRLPDEWVRSEDATLSPLTLYDLSSFDAQPVSFVRLKGPPFYPITLCSFSVPCLLLVLQLLLTMPWLFIRCIRLLLGRWNWSGCCCCCCCCPDSGEVWSLCFTRVVCRHSINARRTENRRLHSTHNPPPLCKNPSET